MAIHTGADLEEEGGSRRPPPFPHEFDPLPPQRAPLCTILKKVHSIFEKIRTTDIISENLSTTTSFDFESNTELNYLWEPTAFSMSLVVLSKLN